MTQKDIISYLANVMKQQRHNTVILENIQTPDQELAYHWTNANPNSILNKGFRNIDNTSFGQTYSNRLGFLYDENIPFENRLFCSSNKTEFSRDGTFCMTLDISGIEKYPDYNHLLDFGVYYNDDDGELWINKFDMGRYNEDLVSLFDYNEGHLKPSDFTGDDSMDIINSCVIDGDLITPDRILNVE